MTSLLRDPRSQWSESDQDRPRTAGGASRLPAYEIAGRFDADLVDPVELGQPHTYVLARSRRNIGADMISANRQLPMTPIHQHCQPNGARPSKITKRVQGGPHSTARVEHVIDQHHSAALHVNRQIGMPHGASRL